MSDETFSKLADYNYILWIFMGGIHIGVVIFGFLG